MKDSSAHVSNINRALRNIKSEIITDFVCLDNRSIIITTNKVSSTLDLQTIERYIKNVKNIKSNQVETLKLPQSKSYLKIIGILYLMEDTNISISTDIVENIIKKNHIFNDIILALRPKVIKIFSKSDISIVWINIWNIQSSSKTRGLINRYFNIRSYIVTIYRANMNPDISQCKNCWKQSHSTRSYRF